MNGMTLSITIIPQIDDIQLILDIQRDLDRVATGFDSEAVALRSMWVAVIFGDA